MKVAASKCIRLFTFSFVINSELGSGTIVNLTLAFMSSGKPAFYCLISCLLRKPCNTLIWIIGLMLTFKTIISCTVLNDLDNVANTLHNLVCDHVQPPDHQTTL